MTRMVKEPDSVHFLSSTNLWQTITTVIVMIIVIVIVLGTQFVWTITTQCSCRQNSGWLCGQELPSRRKFQGGSLGCPSAHPTPLNIMFNQPIQNPTPNIMIILNQIKTDYPLPLLCWQRSCIQKFPNSLVFRPGAQVEVGSRIE